MTRAADVLAALLDDPDPTIRIRAARSLLSFGLRLHDTVDVSKRPQAGGTGERGSGALLVTRETSRWRARRNCRPGRRL